MAEVEITNDEKLSNTDRIQIVMLDGSGKQMAQVSMAKQYEHRGDVWNKAFERLLQEYRLKKQQGLFD